MQRCALGPPTARQHFGIVFALTPRGCPWLSLSFRRSSLRSVSAALALTAVTAINASAQPAAPYLQASVGAAQTVIAVWNAVPGATGYRAEAGISPYQMLAGYELGANVTSFALQAPQGIYYLRVFARNAQGISAPSNVVGITVSSTLAPPAPPTGFAASSAGTTVNLSVGLPAGPLTGLVLAAGVGPGQTQAVVPLPLAPNATIENVPPGTYYARVHALGPGGPSGPSNEVAIVVAPAACLAPSLPAVTATATGSTVAISWTPVAGAAGYILAASGTPGRLADGQPAGGRRHHQRRLSRRAGGHLLRAGDGHQSVRRCGDLGRRRGHGHRARRRRTARRRTRRRRRRPTTCRCPTARPW